MSQLATQDDLRVILGRYEAALQESINEGGDEQEAELAEAREALLGILGQAKNQFTGGNMKIITDTDGDEFGLGKTRNTDGRFFATRSNTKFAILEALRGVAGTNLKITRKTDHRDFCTYVSLISGRLSLGCHTFARKATRAIIRWAGITSTEFAAARRIGQKVRRNR